MKVTDFGVREVWTPKTILYALIGIRIVRTVSFRGNGFDIAIVGVPPWRELRPSDLYKKKCYELEKIR